ncbi:hypothetical protein TNCT_643981 [Trichonephila clavata]|uniref:Uncharacterized protein n=1 Tax=Trichonephila clavata TaxID=2740835 RepID=A0A8X6HGY4_TRICU|nr:hypothetical protein TNCT_643981 [Trichonephila clavata]
MQLFHGLLVKTFCSRNAWLLVTGLTILNRGRVRNWQLPYYGQILYNCNDVKDPSISHGTEKEMKPGPDLNVGQKSQRSANFETKSIKTHCDEEM